MTEKANKTRTIVGCGVLAALVLGVVGGIAIPAWDKHIKQQRSSGATLNIKTINDLVLDYHKEHGSFPASTKLTPLESCCADASILGVGYCPTNDEGWKQEGWVSIGFKVIRQRSTYRFKMTADRDKMLIEAFGDLDCDGEEGRFFMEMTVDDKGVVNSSRLQIENELE